MHRRDRRLERVRAERAATRAPARTSAAPSAICSRFQQRAVLVVEQDQVARRRGARRAPRFVQQHQREQPDRLGLGQQLDQQPPEPDRLGREVVPRQRRRPTRRSSPR